MSMLSYAHVRRPTRNDMILKFVSESGFTSKQHKRVIYMDDF